MAKKKTKAVSHWHRHRSVSGSFISNPFLTMGVFFIVALLLTLIWLTLFVKFNYSLTVSSNTQNQQMLLQK